MSAIWHEKRTATLPRASVGAALVIGYQAWREKLRRARSYRAAIKHLEALDDRMLEDIGILRAEIGEPKTVDRG